MTKHSLTYTLILGDWSDDGHGKKDKYQVEIARDEELTEELIVANYKANVAKLGFGLPELWDEYEKESPNEAELYAIQKHLGAVYYIFDELYSQKSSLLDNALGIELQPLPEDDSDELPFGSFFLTVYNHRLYNQQLRYEDKALDMAMFVMLAGISGVSWKRVEEPPLLFGGRDSLLVGNAQVGYGRYY